MMLMLAAARSQGHVLIGLLLIMLAHLRPWPLLQVHGAQWLAHIAVTAVSIKAGKVQGVCS